MFINIRILIIYIYTNSSKIKRLKSDSEIIIRIQIVICDRFGQILIDSPPNKILRGWWFRLKNKIGHMIPVSSLY